MCRLVYPREFAGSSPGEHEADGSGPATIWWQDLGTASARRNPGKRFKFERSAESSSGLAHGQWIKSRRAVLGPIQSSQTCESRGRNAKWVAGQAAVLQVRGRSDRPGFQGRMPESATDAR